MPEKVAATLIIHRWADMTDEGRTRIKNWLKRQAEFLDEYEPKKFSNRYRARYWFNEE